MGFLWASILPLAFLHASPGTIGFGVIVQKRGEGAPEMSKRIGLCVIWIPMGISFSTYKMATSSIRQHDAGVNLYWHRHHRLKLLS